MKQSHPELDIDTTPAATPDQKERDRVREEYRARLAEKLKDPEFRKIEGFPIGTDEAILALSDPPFYTACPNPFLEEWLQENATPYDTAMDDYHREPFAADVSEGKNDPIYNAHSYHTKVPHKAIMRYILHYTEPGDVVYDGFCGTGMTGVAAQMCGNKAQVESLGYTVRVDGSISDADGEQISRLGARMAILSDLSPTASFIARNLTASTEATGLEIEANQVLKDVTTDLNWLYKTRHINQDGSVVMGEIVYSVWSDLFVCSQCSQPFVAWDTVIDAEAKEMRAEFDCPFCRALLKRRTIDRSMVTEFDPLLGKFNRHTQQQQVLIHYKVGNSRFTKLPDQHDQEVQNKALELLKGMDAPIVSFEHTSRHIKDGNHLRGITHSHHYYTFRNLLALTALKDRISVSKLPLDLLFIFTGLLDGHASRRNRYIMDRHHPEGTTCGPLTNTLFVPELQCEVNIFEVWKKTQKKQIKFHGEKMLRTAAIEVRSATLPPTRDCSVDYIFVDPPFGKNILYSDLNLLWEAWLGVLTQTTSEAIINDAQKKQISEYNDLMASAFTAFFNVLKPGRWMTLEFHNSLNAVWNVIQEALARAGFVVADVRILDKEHGTIHQDSGYTVKQDLVVSAYKPYADFEQRFQIMGGKPEGVLEFVRQHLSMLPIAPITKGGKLEPVAERTRYLLFDRMIAYHLQHGTPIPMDSAAFHKLLEDQFTTRDEMYFLPDQAARYDAMKSRGYETEQLSIFLQDEKSAVQWVRAELSENGHTLGDLTPKFMQELREWPAHEPRPELRDLLREYFIQSDSGVWRVPNPDDEKDIEALRKSALLRLFQGYAKEKGALKTFRKEAVMEGFKQCYETNQYGVIVAVCEKIPEKVFQEIPEFVMFYDIAKDLAPERVEQTEFVWE